MAEYIPMKPLTPEESIALLDAKAQQAGDDFRLKVMRRPSPHAPLEAVATFDGARVEHFANVETWLPDLAGGGEHYVLQAMHSSDPNKMIAMVVAPKMPGPAQPVNLDAMRDPAWKGPTQLKYPNVTERSDRTPGGPVGAAQTHRSEWRGPRAAVSGDAGDFFRRELELKEREHKIHTEEVTKRHEEDMRRIKEEVMSIRQAAQRPQEPATKGLAELAAIFAPVLQEIVRQNHETRLTMLKLEQDRVAKLAERPAVDPLVMNLLEKSQSRADESAKMFSSYGEALSSMTRSMVQTVTTMAELQLRGQEPAEEGVLPIIKEAIRAFGAMSAMSPKVPMPTPPQAQAPRLPPQQRRQAPPPQRKATPAQQNGSAQRPANVGPIRPVPAPVEDSSPKQQSFSGLDPEYLQERQEDVKKNPDDLGGLPVVTADTIEAQIRAMEDPEDVADTIIHAIQYSDDFKAELAEHQGDLTALFERRLGPWAMEADDHREYVAALMEALEEAAKDANALQTVEEEEPEEAEEIA